jgi:hypothetical protein
MEQVNKPAKEQDAKTAVSYIRVPAASRNGDDLALQQQRKAVRKKAKELDVKIKIKQLYR